LNLARVLVAAGCRLRLLAPSFCPARNEPGTQRPPGASVPSSRYPLPATRYPLPATRYPLPATPRNGFAVHPA